MTTDTAPQSETAAAPEAQASAPAPASPVTRVKDAIATMNKAVGADIHDRLHAQANAITAIADLLFS